MAYGTANVDVIQSSTANTPVQFNDGNGTQVGTLCRSWVNFNSSGTILGSFNVSSVTKDGTGSWVVNFTNAMPDTNYAVSGIGQSGSYGFGTFIQLEGQTYAALKSTTQVRVSTRNDGSTLVDSVNNSVVVFR